uniref:Odorant-binding protein n=1 Tax=Glossina brevipalpis TaxID=37001 RepID=A0A1A9X2Z4_9MUSC
MKSERPLRCRTDDGPSEAELKRVTRNCMRKFSDNYMQTTLNGHQQNQQLEQYHGGGGGGGGGGGAGQYSRHDQHFPYRTHNYDYDASYDDGNENYEDNGGAGINFNFYGHQSNNPNNHNNRNNNDNNNNNNNNNNNRQNYGNNHRGGVGSTNNEDYMAQRNRERNVNSRSNGGNGGDYPNYNQRNQFKSYGYINDNNNNNNNSTQYNNRYNNNNNRKNINNNNNNSNEVFCLVHCFFEQMQMLNNRHYPDRHKVLYVLTKDIRDHELRNFYTDTIQQCFHYLESLRPRDKCQFSRDLINCMTEYAKGNCDDWNEFNMMFN